MSKPYTTNAPVSAGTSKAPRPSNKAEFLEYKADVAKKAFFCSVRRAVKELSSFVDPRAWTRRYPLPSVGVAVAAGFMGGTRLTTGKKTEGVPAENSARHESPQPQSPKESSAAPSLTSLLVSLGMDVVTKAVMPVVTRQLHEMMNRKREEAKTTEGTRNPPEASDSTVLRS